MQKFKIIEKAVGETPLQCMEKWRVTQSPAYQNIPLAYAGRLDPMASGKLLILIGDECKKQKKYHNLDKEYEFEVLCGISSDTRDVLGLIDAYYVTKYNFDLKKSIEKICEKIIGEIELPYPHFSAKTVQGKPLHVWTLENRLDEIEIPTKESFIYSLKPLSYKNLSTKEIYDFVSEKIETIPKVTEASKALGNDFRRPLVRESWKKWYEANYPSKKTVSWGVIKFKCICSSGTYMRTLAGVIGKELGTCGMAYSIHRTKLGIHKKLPFNLSVWIKQFN